MKERSSSTTRLLSPSPFSESKNSSKATLGSEIYPKSGSGTPRRLPPIEDLQAYFKMLETQEEKALILIIKEIDSLTCS